MNVYTDNMCAFMCIIVVIIAVLISAVILLVFINALNEVSRNKTCKNTQGKRRPTYSE